MEVRQAHKPLTSRNHTVAPGDTFLTGKSPVGSAGLKAVRREPTAVCLLLSKIRVGSFGDDGGGVKELLGDAGVSACGGVGQVEHQRLVQWIRPDREGFVQDPITADALGPDAVVSQVPFEVAIADRLDAQAVLPEIRTRRWACTARWPGDARARLALFAR
jgi:hypothetical protein